jgi:hypothetical protein
MAVETANRVLDFVRSHEADVIELLRHMVDAESPSTSPDSHQLII